MDQWINTAYWWSTWLPGRDLWPITWQADSITWQADSITWQADSITWLHHMTSWLHHMTPSHDKLTPSQNVNSMLQYHHKERLDNGISKQHETHNRNQQLHQQFHYNRTLKLMVRPAMLWCLLPGGIIKTWGLAKKRLRTYIDYKYRIE